MHTEQVYLVKTCTTVHACCDTVSAYQYLDLAVSNSK